MCGMWTRCLSAALLALVLLPHDVLPFRRLQKSALTQVPDATSPSPYYQHAHTLPCSRQPLNLVYLMNPNPVDSGGGLSETDWIENVVLGGLQRPIRIWTTPTKLNNSLYVYLAFDAHHRQLFADMKREGYTNFGVYEMGDEKWSSDPAAYAHYNDWDYGFRNYFNPVVARHYPHITYVHLGQRSGFGQLAQTRLLPATQRPTACNFVGSLRANRDDMVSTLRAAGVDCFVSADSSWEAAENIHTISYRHILQNSVFTLAPWGNNGETLRVYEALEAGSIPIVQRGDPAVPHTTHLFLTALNKRRPPFPVVASWSEAAVLLVEKGTDVDRIQRDSLAWWNDTKSIMQATVADAVERSFKQHWRSGHVQGWRTKHLVC